MGAGLRRSLRGGTESKKQENRKVNNHEKCIK